MQRSGVLHIEGMESRLDNILLARQGSTNPVGEATKFLEVTCQVGDGDTVTVEGITDKIGREDVIYVRNAWRIETIANGKSVPAPAPEPPPAMKPAVEWVPPVVHKPVKRVKPLVTPTPTPWPAPPPPAPVATPAVVVETTKAVAPKNAVNTTAVKKAATKKTAAKKAAPKKAAVKKAAVKRSGKTPLKKTAVPKRDGESKLRFKNKNKAKTSHRGKVGSGRK